MKLTVHNLAIGVSASLLILAAGCGKKGDAAKGEPVAPDTIKTEGARSSKGQADAARERMNRPQHGGPPMGQGGPPMGQGGPPQ